MSHRIEDTRFITGGGRFTEDLSFPDALHAFFVRSPHAHARIQSFDTTAAAAMPGVAAIYTGADITAAGLGPLRSMVTLGHQPHDQYADPTRPLLATDCARYVGEEVAMVIAATPAAAQSAAEAITVDYLTLPHVIDAREALLPTAPQLWPTIPGNRSIAWRFGDADAVAKAMDSAQHIVSAKLLNNRLVCCPTEPRAAVGLFDADADRFTLFTPSQGVHLLQSFIAGPVFGVPREQLRVVTPDVGGGFGMKQFAYREQALVLFAARQLRRPVRWVSDRAEAFLSDLQARDIHYSGRLALDHTGTVSAFDIQATANLGASLSTFAISIPTKGLAKMATGAYAIPALSIRVEGAYTNTAPVDAYRGAGKPEAHYLLERLMEQAALVLDEDPAAFRRRHLITPAKLPYRTASGQTVDSGDFPRLLDQALERAQWHGFAARRDAARARGRYRGIGMGIYMHGTGGTADETGRIEIAPSGRITVYAGTQSSGQSHETTFAKVVAHRLGVAMDGIQLVQGDTDRIPRGGGSGGSSSLIISANTLHAAADDLINRALPLAADHMEAAVEDVRFAAGAYVISGTDQRVTLIALAQAHTPEEGDSVALWGEADFSADNASYPAGVQIAELEVDPETGSVALVAYTSVDDIGTVIDAGIVKGQIHGGITQGIGQALMENCLYDAENGQLLTGSLMDYAVPRAGDLPEFSVCLQSTATSNNPLGAKGVGECGTIGASGAVMNAVLNALRPYGVVDLDMPATALNIWQALQKGSNNE